MKTRTVALLAAAVCLKSPALVAAQPINPELGDVAQPKARQQQQQPGQGAASGQAQAGTRTGGKAQAQGRWSPSPEAPPQQADSDETVGDTDHDEVVGTLGIGFFGIRQIPAMGCNAPNPQGCLVPNRGASPIDAGFTVPAPTIGARYWLSRRFGVEAGLGLGIASETVERSVEGMSGVTVLEPASHTAFALHGGMPIALFIHEHFVIEAIPELQVGFSTGSFRAQDPMNDLSLSGFLFRVGARAGAEVHFGFIDLPRLALQGTVGLHLSVESRSAEGRNMLGATTTIDAATTRFRTSVQNNPWDIFTGNISAIYYF